MDIETIRKEKPIQELLNFSILNINKPADWTSFDVVNKIRGMFGLNKCGHFGTLDPQVTGVLPICLGKACRIQDFFMHREKVYIGKMQFHKEISQEEVEKSMAKFIGKISQLPPRKSSVKRVVRKREIIEFKMVKFDQKKKIAEFYAHVEAGTYIRKLISDLGEILGIGAQMIELKRVKAGLFSDTDKEFIDMAELELALNLYKEGHEEELRRILIPAEIITKILPVIEVKPEFADKLLHGSPFFEGMIEEDRYDETTKIIESKQPFCIVSGDKLLQIAKFSDKFENEEILAKPETVIN
jgi:H/ACA ribonucleoprotein complex subunit 4